MTSSDEAFLLLRKWKSERSSMRFILAFAVGGGSFKGRVGAVTSSTVSLVGDEFTFELSLLKARFEYSDSRHAPDELSDKADKFVGSLTAFLPGNIRLRFFELSI